MLELAVTSQFKKDLKRIRKQGKDLTLLENILQLLLEEKVFFQNRKSF
jgi:mRNA interferase YafQ